MLLSPGHGEDGSQQLLLRESACSDGSPEARRLRREEQRRGAHHPELAGGGRFEFRVDEPVGEALPGVPGELPQVALRRALVAHVVFVREYDEPGDVHVHGERGERLRGLRGYLELPRGREVPGRTGGRGDDVQRQDDGKRSRGAPEAHPGEPSPAAAHRADEIPHGAGRGERQQHARRDERGHGERTEVGGPYDEEQPPERADASERREQQAPAAQPLHDPAAGRWPPVHRHRRDSRLSVVRKRKSAMNVMK